MILFYKKLNINKYIYIYRGSSIYKLTTSYITIKLYKHITTLNLALNNFLVKILNNNNIT